MGINQINSRRETRATGASHLGEYNNPQKNNMMLASFLKIRLLKTLRIYDVYLLDAADRHILFTLNLGSVSFFYDISLKEDTALDQIHHVQQYLNASLKAPPSFFLLLRPFFSRPSLAVEHNMRDSDDDSTCVII